jgi:hypothetical protein
MGVDVLCIGHAAYDLSVLLEGFPTENSKCETDRLLECGGGPAANAAYLLSLWGTRAGFAGLVGDDRYGRSVRDEFQAVGTDVSLLELRAGHATPVSMILINRQNGSRTIVNRKAPGAGLQLEAAGAFLRPPVGEVGFLPLNDFLKHSGWMDRIVRESEFVDPGLFREYYEHLARGYARGVRVAQMAHEVDARYDPEVIAFAYTGIGNFVGMRWADWTAGGRVPDDVLDDVLELLGRGLAPGDSA